MAFQPPSSRPDVEYRRDDTGRFAPGTGSHYAPRKGKLGGRAQALRTLDQMLAKDQNQENLANALQAHFDEDPVRFFKTLVMPLLPQDLKVHATADTGFSWMSLPDMIGRKTTSRLDFEDATDN